MKKEGIWLMLCGAEKWSQKQGWGQDGALPGVAGLAPISPQVGIGESGTRGQEWVSTLDLKPIPAFSMLLRGWAGIGEEIGSPFFDRAWG